MIHTIAIFLDFFSNRRHPFSEAMIELDDKKATTSNVLVDGERGCDTTKIYVKVHQGYLSFFGTGKIHGHPKPAGVPSKHAMRCFLACPFVLLLIFVFLLVGLGIMIYYLVAL